MQFLISTDLDGTLLDHYDYSWHTASEALQMCLQRDIPVIFNTSKTAREVETLQSTMVQDGKMTAGPMIVENGSALSLPNEYLNARINNDYLMQTGLDSSSVIRSAQSTQILFGSKRIDLLTFIAQVRQRSGWAFEGFNDWTTQEIAQRTGLTEEVARSAADKLYSEPLVWNDSDESLIEFTQLAMDNGYQVLRGGRFYHLQGDTNKGLPILWLQRHILQLYQASGEVDDSPSGNLTPELICLGDNRNDIDMLNIADFPVCVRSPVSEYPQLQTDKKIYYTDGEGPIGWNEAVLSILSEAR